MSLHTSKGVSVNVGFPLGTLGDSCCSELCAARFALEAILVAVRSLADASEGASADLPSYHKDFLDRFAGLENVVAPSRVMLLQDNQLIANALVTGTMSGSLDVSSRGVPQLQEVLDECVAIARELQVTCGISVHAFWTPAHTEGGNEKVNTLADEQASLAAGQAVATGPVALSCGP